MMAFVFALKLQLLLVPALGVSFSPVENSFGSLGVMNKLGVTRYTTGTLKKTKKKSGFWWPGTSRNSEAEYFTGPDDLTENVSWGWHHPNGFFNSIPVGQPLVDADMNIYLGSDDAIRKFDYSGNLIWIYAPRGLLVAAPTLCTSTIRRMKQTESGLSMDDNQAEEELKPSWMEGGEQDDKGDIKEVKEGDTLEVKEGTQHSVEGEEVYKAGDIGEVTKVTTVGNHKHATIMWKRTLLQSTTAVSALHKSFSKISKMRVAARANVLIGVINDRDDSSLGGAVFSVDLATGEELWVTKTSTMIQGVKGAVACHDGVAVVATDKCVDRYCYRYRYVTNPLWPANSKVRGISVVDGHSLWEFMPRSPVWNFIPQFSEASYNTTVFFQDIEGSAYALDLQDGVEKWRTYGYMGTYSQGHIIYSSWHDAVYTMLVKYYDVGNGYEAAKACNPYVHRGIHVNCGTWPYKAGEIWMINASSGLRLRVSAELPHPPASGTLGMPSSAHGHGRLVLGIGHNCHYNSPTLLYVLNPDTLTVHWQVKGPTLWSWYCAGDKEGGDIRRAMGQRELCKPGAWTTPAVDSNGDIYIGNQVGELQRWGSASGNTAHDIELKSTLSTGVAFQDNAFSFAPGMMAVATCTSLIVFHTSRVNSTFFTNETWKQDLVPTLPYDALHKPFGVDGPATHGKPVQHDNGTYFRPYDVNSMDR